MEFKLKDIGLDIYEAPCRTMKKQFLPANSDFYSYVASRGIGLCPTLVPVFYYGIDKTGTIQGIETCLLTESEFSDGISQKQPDGIEQVFRDYMSGKGFGEDVFNMDSPEKVEVFLSNNTRLGWLE